jgi:hypothetical protein
MQSAVCLRDVENKHDVLPYHRLFSHKVLKCHYNLRNEIITVIELMDRYKACSVVGWGTMLQAGKLRVRFSVR